MISNNYYIKKRDCIEKNPLNMQILGDNSSINLKISLDRVNTYMLQKGLGECIVRKGTEEGCIEPYIIYSLSLRKGIIETVVLSGYTNSELVDILEVLYNFLINLTKF